MTELPLSLPRRPRPSSRSLLEVMARPGAALGALVLVSTLVRLLAVLGRETQRYFPDEFMYGQLARSLAAGDGYAVLGEHSTFPSPLQPLLTAPVWLPGDPELAFRLTQGLNAIAMSLAAIPVYLLCRRLALARGTCLLAAAAAVALPDLLYAGYVTADALGYLLALVAVERGVAALAAPGGRRTALFLGACALATLDRMQYAALVAAAVPAAIATERSVRGAIRRHAVLIASGTALAAGGLALSQVGPYAAVSTFRLDAGTIAWLPRSLWGVALACGAAVVPGAVVWLGAELRRKTDAARSAFAGLSVALTALLVAAAALMADQTGSERFFERYLMVLLPLVVVAFACWAESGAAAPRVAAAVALGITIAAMAAPVSSLAAGQGRADSPFLLAVGRLEGAVGVGSASLAVALAATCAAWLGAALGRRGATPVLGLTLLLFALVSVGAHAADRELSAGLVARQVGDPGWIDAVADAPVTLIHGAGSDRATSMVLALRNRAVRRGAVLGEADAFSGFGLRARVDGRGRVLVGAAPLTGAAVLDDPTTRLIAAPGDAVAGPEGATLLRPGGRVEALVQGLGEDGLLAPQATLTVLPAGPPGTCRTLTLAVTAPAGGRPVVLRLDGHTHVLSPGSTRRVGVVAADRARRVTMTSSPATRVAGGTRSVTARAGTTVTTATCGDRRNP